jgi:hypothetical protein
LVRKGKPARRLDAGNSFSRGSALTRYSTLLRVGEVLSRRFGLTDPTAAGVIRVGIHSHLYAGVYALAYATADFRFSPQANRKRAKNVAISAGRAWRDDDSIRARRWAIKQITGGNRNG